MPRGVYDRTKSQPTGELEPAEQFEQSDLAAIIARLDVIEQRINKMNETFASGYMPQNVGIP